MMSVTEHLDSLKAKHLDLEQLIEQEEARPRPDEVKIHELKRQNSESRTKSPNSPDTDVPLDASVQASARSLGAGAEMKAPPGPPGSPEHNRRIPIWLLSWASAVRKHAPESVTLT